MAGGADARDHQVVEDAAVVGEKLRIALLAGLQAQDIGRESALRAPAPRSRGSCPRRRRKAWPMWETSNRPACSRVQWCSVEDAGGVLHRHVVAGEGHHAGAKGDMLGMKRGLAGAARRLWTGSAIGFPQRRAFHRASRPVLRAPSVPRPERFPRRFQRQVTPFGGRRLSKRRRFPECQLPRGPFA